MSKNYRCTKCVHFKKHYSPSLHMYISTCKAPRPLPIGCVGVYKKKEEKTNG